jgi:hypothetical protein
MAIFPAMPKEVCHGKGEVLENLSVQEKQNVLCEMMISHNTFFANQFKVQLVV